MADYKKQLEEAIKEAQKIAREINDIIDPDKNEFKKQWDHDICIQFCQAIPGMRNYVDQRCPDHCLEKHPDWRRITDYDQKEAKKKAEDNLENLLALRELLNEGQMHPAILQKALNSQLE